MPKKQNKTWLYLVLVVLIVGVGAYGAYRLYRHYQVKPIASSPNPQTTLGNQSEISPGSTNTDLQNQTLSADKSPAPASQSIQLPTPSLSKSSGNNGTKVPVGAVVEFICKAPAGYNCNLILSGPSATSLGVKPINDDGRTTTAALWDWPAKKGSWTVAAVLSDGKGNEQKSESQSLEVN